MSFSLRDPFSCFRWPSKPGLSGSVYQGWVAIGAAEEGTKLF